MANIWVQYTGDGTAWVSNPTPNIGEQITLYAIPADGATLDDIEAWDEYGYSVALYVQEEQDFICNSNTITIQVTFSEPKIHIYVDGNGTASVSNRYPSVSEIVTLYIDPMPRQRILSVIGYDENGNVVRFRNRKVQSFMWTYQTLDIYITIRIDNKIDKRMPIWMYPRLRKCFT